MHSKIFNLNPEKSLRATVLKITEPKLLEQKYQTCREFGFTVTQAKLISELCFTLGLIDTLETLTVDSKNNPSHKHLQNNLKNLISSLKNEGCAVTPVKDGVYKVITKITAISEYIGIVEDVFNFKNRLFSSINQIAKENTTVDESPKI
ncbi:MAG: hypothetical protein HYX60_08770 [Legionella longbeachae]|nr:hypothetical protein [Legionella longbeachae]